MCQAGERTLRCLSCRAHLDVPSDSKKSRQQRDPSSVAGARISAAAHLAYEYWVIPGRDWGTAGVPSTRMASRRIISRR